MKTTSNPGAVSFALHIEPLPCPRPRIATRGRFAHAYYPASYKTWKERAQAAITAALGCSEESPRFPQGPLEVHVDFFCTKPRTSKLAIPKPDIDNYLKSFMDAATQAGVWDDDCQVQTVRATKVWGEKPGIVVVIFPKEVD